VDFSRSALAALSRDGPTSIVSESSHSSEVADMAGGGPAPEVQRRISRVAESVRRSIYRVLRPVDLVIRGIASVISCGIVVVVVILIIGGSGFAVVKWWNTDGPAGPHWGHRYICTEYKTVMMDKFNGPDEECVAGYWQP
jgi:hypothetical protein